MELKKRSQKMFALPTVFLLIPSVFGEFGDGSQISKNFRDLFEAVATKNNTQRELKESLYESQRRQEELFNAFDREVKLMKESRRSIYGDYRNETTRQKKESVDEKWGIFNEKRFCDSLERELQKLNDQEKIELLTAKLVEAEKEIVRLGGIVSKIDDQKTNLKSLASAVVVATYASRKFELYEAVWNTGGKNPKEFKDFDANYVPENLPDNSQADYKRHHTIWRTILDSSIHPGAIRFKNYLLLKKYGITQPGEKELNTEIISRNIAFAVVMVQNSKHGPAAKSVGLSLLKTAREVKDALALSGCIEDPLVLSVVEMFEQVTTGTEDVTEGTEDMLQQEPRRV